MGCFTEGLLYTRTLLAEVLDLLIQATLDEVQLILHNH